MPDIVDMPSINEPPGSDVTPAGAQQAQTQPAKAAVKSAAAGGRDPDDLEDEIEAAEDDDDVEIKTGKKGKKK